MGRIIDLAVDWISLVKRPATGKALVLKNDDAKARLFEIVKTDDDKMVAYGIVYPVEQEDSQGDIASVDVVRGAAYNFMAKARVQNVDKEHGFDSIQAFVAESWLVRKGDPLFPDEPEGSWAAGVQIGDPQVWKQLKSGELTGFSLAGLAREEVAVVTTFKNDDSDNGGGGTGEGFISHFPDWFQQLVKAATPQSTQTKDDEDMDAAAIRTLVGEEVTKAIGPAVTAALKSAGLGNGTDAAANDPKPQGGEGGASEEPTLEDKISTAIAKGMEGLEPKLETMVAKAVAKGVTETGDPAAPAETFA